MSIDPLDDDEVLLLEESAEYALPVWEPTGDPAVDAALEELTRLDDLGTAAHIEVFSAIHEALRQRLVDIGK